MFNRNRVSRDSGGRRRSTATVVAVTATALVGGALLSAGPALADPDRNWYPARDRGAGYDYARVVDVDPIVRHVRVRTPVRECWEETRYDDYDRRDRHHGHYRDYRDDRHRGGEAGATIAGGIIGGVIGRQFGDGKGRDAMTLVGTLVGAAIGNERANRGREYDEHYERYGAYERQSYPVTRCETRYRTDAEERIDGYRVTYRYRGQTYTTRTDYDPGDRIRVRVEVEPVRY